MCHLISNNILVIVLLWSIRNDFPEEVVFRYTEVMRLAVKEWIFPKFLVSLKNPWKYKNEIVWNMLHWKTLLKKFSSKNVFRKSSEFLWIFFPDHCKVKYLEVRKYHDIVWQFSSIENIALHISLWEGITQIYVSS